MMENTSGLSPRGRAVLVKPYEPELKTGMIALPDSVRARMTMVDQRAIVVAIGPSAWYDEPEPRAKVGERVLVTKFAGFMVSPSDSADGEEYRLVNDRDIFCAMQGAS